MVYGRRRSPRRRVGGGPPRRRGPSSIAKEGLELLAKISDARNVRVAGNAAVLVLGIGVGTHAVRRATHRRREPVAEVAREAVPVVRRSRLEAAGGLVLDHEGRR